MDTPEKESDARSPELLISTGGTDSSLLATALAETSVAPDGKKKQARRSISPLRDSLRRLSRDWRTKACVGVLGFFVLLALFGPFLYQHIGGPYTSHIDGTTYSAAVYHNYTHEELDRQHELPSAQYWLGTDDLGRDILARLMQGVLISLGLAVAVEIVDLGLGILIGVLAGYYGGWIDQLLARFTDLIFAFPTLLFLIMVSAMLGEVSDTLLSHSFLFANGNGRLLVIFLALALFVWPSTARLVRGQTLQIKQQQYIEAARTSGTGNVRIILRHIIPNLLSIAIVSAMLDMVGTIGAEAGISLLGLGIQSPDSSIGLMISSASPYITVHPWEIMVPSVVLTVIILAFSFFGDAVQDAFEPQ